MQPKMDRENWCEPCVEFEPMLALLAADELNPAERAELAEHLARCASCRETLDRETELLALIAEHRTEPDGALLSSCRAGLEDALDREEERGSFRGLIARILPDGWIAPRPAWSAALLLLMGFSVGLDRNTAGTLPSRLIGRHVAESASARK